MRYFDDPPIWRLSTVLLSNARMKSPAAGGSRFGAGAIGVPRLSEDLATFSPHAPLMSTSFGIGQRAPGHINRSMTWQSHDHISKGPPATSSPLRRRGNPPTTASF